MKNIAILLAFLVTLSSPVTAQDFDKGVDAYRSGDYATAIIEWRPLAETGNSGAQFLLGAAYYFGHGVIQDDKQAANWYRLAAEQKHSSAQYYIGIMFENGRGVLQDNILAHMWFNISADNLSKVGREHRDRLAKKMCPSDISKAQAMARECLRSDYKKCGY
jgi:uncharacterized protein